MIRASAVSYLGRYPGPVITAVLTRLSTDRDPLVRLEIARALGGSIETAVVEALSRMLSDTYRSVRIQAIASLITQTFSPQPPKLNKDRPEFVEALKEYRNSLEVEADDPAIEARLGSLEFFAGDLSAARAAFLTALRLDSRQADAYVGLALIEARLGNAGKAVKNAQKAVESSSNPAYRTFLERMKSIKP